MFYNDTSDQAREYANSAFAKMAELSIPSTPINFTVWYDYFAGRNLELVRAIDILISNNTEFVEERNLDLYCNFCNTSGDDVVQETSVRLQEQVERIMAQLGEAGLNTVAYSEKLSDYSGELASGGGAEDVVKVVRGILSETQSVLVKSRAMESKLKESSDEIAVLRENLEQVQREALTDSLTGIGNRKFFDTSLSNEATLAMESGDQVCLLLGDVDHFKAFNDRFGHRVGDQVLKIVGRTLKASVKGRDIPCRYGGEEFAVILPQTVLEDAVAVAEGIRTTLSLREIKNAKSGESYGTVTLSIGVAQYRYGEPLTELVQRADEGLYQAKRDGRNRVVCETALDSGVTLAG